MRNVSKAIISYICCFAILFSVTAVPASAANYQSKSDFWTWMTQVAPFPTLTAQITSVLSGKVCAESPDQYHHADSFQDDFENGYYACVCKYCGKTYKAYKKDIPGGYGDYYTDIVEPTIGGPAISSDGYYIIVSGPETLLSSDALHYGTYSPGPPVTYRFGGCGSSQIFLWGSGGIVFETTVPGYYTWSPLNLSTSNVKIFQSANLSRAYWPVGTNMCSPSFSVKLIDKSLTGIVSFIPAWLVEPDAYDPNDYTAPIGGSGSRPGSIVGLYGDVNGEAFSNNSATIVNEKNKTLYNPVTNTNVTYDNWSYDYSSRTYTLTKTAEDNTVTTTTVNYGDEVITITEGDTVYNVYYMVDKDTSDCDHDYTVTSTVDPTCTAAGKTTKTCSKCGDVVTETIPATGHDWTVKQTVKTEYDDSGNLVTEGYTLYECSICGEQYKSTDGVGPPAPSPDDGSGGTTIGGLIEQLLSGIGSIASGLIKGILALLTKAVEALAGIGDLFTQFITSVIGLFSGFTDFLVAVFPFLPEEFFTIISLGMVLLVAAAVLRRFLG